MDVALDDDHLRLARDAGQPQAGRHLAGVHGATGRQGRLLGVLDDQEAERPGVAQRLTHHLGAGDRLHAIGKRHRASFVEHAHLGQLLALQSPGHGAVGIDLGQAEQAGAPGDELDHRHIVDHRKCIGQANHRRDAAGGSRSAGRGQRALVLLARLTELHADVDQAGGEALSPAIDHLGVIGNRAGYDPRAEVGDALAVGEQAADEVEPGGGIEQTGVEVGNPGLGWSAPAPRHRAHRSRRRHRRPRCRPRPSPFGQMLCRSTPEG